MLQRWLLYIRGKTFAKKVETLGCECKLTRVSIHLNVTRVSSVK